MAATAPTKKPKRRARPVWLRVETLVRPDTGEEVPAFVPAHAMDRDECRRRKYKRGLVLKGELKQRRDPTNWRRMHALAAWVAQNVDGFEELAAAEDWHGVLKRLQAESGVACEPMELDLGALGKHEVKVPCSLAFDELDETECKRVHQGISQHVVRRYFGELDQRAQDEITKMLRWPEGGVE